MKLQSKTFQYADNLTDWVNGNPTLVVVSICTSDRFTNGGEGYTLFFREPELFIDYEGFRYWYEHRPAKHRQDICLATKDPQRYCNGFYLYSDKDPGSGKAFVVTRTNNPDPRWMDN